MHARITSLLAALARVRVQGFAAAKRALALW
jgi:hypothetical protein